MYLPEIRTVNVTRYVTPLREGGSLPAIVEADDGFLYVLKFRGAGQGAKALIAELIGGEVARVLGLKMPELVFAYLDDSFSKTEPDEEIQDLLKASTGLNLGVHYLSGSITYDPIVKTIDATLAAKIVLMDYVLTNVDRTVRNTNMLVWHQELWLIDHGACLYFHHNWDTWEMQAQKPFSLIQNHVLFRPSMDFRSAIAELRQKLTPDVIKGIVDLIPEAWLMTAAEGDAELEQQRSVYQRFIDTRVSMLDFFVKLLTPADE
jgi:Phosphatidylinositol 3- and 4-kinase